MSDIIAGDPAPTNPTAAIRADMNARERLQVMIRTNRGSMTVWSESEVADAFDAYRAEVLAERDAKLLCSALNLGEGADAFIADYDARKRAEVLAEAANRLNEVFRLAPVPGTADGINFAIGILMSLRGESR